MTLHPVPKPTKQPKRVAPRPGGIQQLLLVREHPMVKKLEDLQKRDERAGPA